MSVTGKGSLSIRKEDVREQKSLTVGFKKITFAHKATLGATGINLGSLTVPTEMSSVGFTNPTAAELLAAQLLFYRKNLTLVSSIKGPLMDYLSYDISSSSRISFNGFTAEDGEIFIGTIDYNARNGFPLVDAAPLVSSGTLAVAVTDFNVGQMFEVNKYSSQQVGAVIVYRNGVQQFRNTGNSSTVLDANYYEVNNGSGTGQIIRFNNAPVGDSDSILVVSNGLLAYNPDGSALQQIEALAGKIDAMVPTLADLAGVPETDFQAAPSNVDLKSFGDAVLSQGTRITTLETEETYACLVVASGATTIAASSVDTKILYNSIVRDVYSSFNTSTNTWTCPSTGWYRIIASIRFDTAAWTALDRHEMLLYKSLISIGYIKSDLMPVTGSYFPGSLSGSRDIFMLAGETLDIRVRQPAGTTRNIIIDSTVNFLSIVKQGTQL